MAIIRDHNRKYFCAVDSRIIRNRMLTIPALGFLTALLDRSDGWQFRSVEVSRTLNLTPEETSRLFSELIEKGFAVEHRDRYGPYYDVYSFPERPQQQTTAPPTAEAAPEEKRGSGPMTDEERAAWFDLIKANFKPTRDYRSPYRD